MAPRRRKRKTRRSRGTSLINALEAYTYGAILSEGVAGTSPWGFFTGDADIGYRNVSLGIGGADGRGSGMTGMQLVGASQISLGDLISNPSLSLNEMSKNLQSNLVPMAIQSLLTGVSFRFGKRLLRRPIANINRNIMAPMFGKGFVRL